MKANSIIRTTIAAATAAALFASAAAGSAFAREEPFGGEELPPNCEIVTVEGTGKGKHGGLSYSYIECHLPPQCEIVHHQQEGSRVGFSTIECDIEDTCSLQSGEWHGHTYWYITCLEHVPGDGPGVATEPFDPNASNDMAPRR